MLTLAENAEGYRLLLDDKVLVESNNKNMPERGQVIEAPVKFGDTQPHAIRLEYFHGTGSAGIDLTWQAPADVLRDEAGQDCPAGGCDCGNSRPFSVP